MVSLNLTIVLSGAKTEAKICNLFYGQVLVVYAHQLATAVCSRSSIRADDTPAVQELTPDDPGAPSLATMTKIRCTDGVLAEEVRG